MARLGEGNGDNAIKESCAPSEENSHNALIADVERKSLSERDLCDGDRWQVKSDFSRRHDTWGGSTGTCDLSPSVPHLMSGTSRREVRP